MVASNQHHARLVEQINRAGPPSPAIAARSRELSSLMGALAPVIASHVESKIAQAIEPLLDRIEQLETAKAKSVAGIRWCGVWQSGKTFAEGELVTDAGALWLARRSVRIGERPGKGDAFVLVVKRGDHDR